LGRDGRYLVSPQGAKAGIRQSVYLEPMETRVLFGLNRIGRVELPQSPLEDAGKQRQLYANIGGDLHYEQRDEIAFRYDVFSHAEASARGLEAISVNAYRQRAAAAGRRYGRQNTQVPDALSAEIQALGAKVVGDAPTVGEAVTRVETYLRKNYEYTLDLRRDESLPPLDDFLFVQRKGHCEYFSSAMVILLRTQGIAARNVNGFYGGEWNSYGNYLAVRQGDAHSWVEVGFPTERCASPTGPCHWTFQWITRDPTPPGAPGSLAVASFWDTFRQYADALRMRWYRNIIEYDLEQQIGFAASLRSTWRAIFGDDEDPRGGTGAETRAWLQRGLTWTLGGVLILAALLISLRRLRGRSVTRQATPADHAAQLFERFAARYAHLGYPRSPSMTAREYVANLVAKDAPRLEVAREVLGAYEAVRFAGAAPNVEQVQQLTRRIGAVRAP
jgi:transglutaminase-like putative cysteine protease